MLRRGMLCEGWIRLAKESCEIVKGMNYSSTITKETKLTEEPLLFSKQYELIEEEEFLLEECILMIGRNRQ